MTSIAIVDDQSVSRKLLEKLVSSLADDPDIGVFADPLDALRWLQDHTPDLILTDYKMPHINGTEFLLRVRQIPRCADVPVIVITCVEDREVRYRALEAGATDFLTKPIDHLECRARCRNLLTLRQQQQLIKERAARLEHQVSDATREIRFREQETLIRLAKAGEFRNEETGNHVIRMSRYSRLICETLKLSHSDCTVIEGAAPMHDIGKIGVADTILLKPGKHTPEETAAMRQHTLIGYEILKDSPSEYLQMGAVIALGHHEKYGGGGYPYGLAGDEIPLPARIVAVADVFDALTSVRPYKHAWSLEDAIAQIEAQRGRHFDPDCVDAFLGRIGDVTEIYHDLRDTPMTQTR